MDYYNSNTELYHHGILGQKWGVRRWQYEDGTWTPEGRKRYGNSDVKYDIPGRLSDQYGKIQSRVIRSKSKKPGTIGKIRNYAAAQTREVFRNDANMRNFIFGKEYDKNTMRWHLSTTAAGLATGAGAGIVSSILSKPALVVNDPGAKALIVTGSIIAGSIIGGAGGYIVKNKVEDVYDRLHEDDR